ncbi:Uncharacterized protein DIS24_g1119 [Lasiodiplodia hormozganensis]|uniref:DUF521 domain protein n=1 Tax=Lasiodiplodia hormozganensis TaxID=869390 RepID=A0AA39Z419_9PEZI|nr:Uncharacterized protein DIS24_g1119 [Lasiodiplodia hormozganensis]
MGSVGINGLTVHGTAYVSGNASGEVVASDVELSFWGGVDPQTGEVIDRHHPLSGKSLKDAILVIPGGRGSCSGSGVMLQLLLNDMGPRAILFERREDILTLGVVVAEELFGKSIPVITLSSTDFRSALSASYLYVDGTRVSTQARNPALIKDGSEASPAPSAAAAIKLTPTDQAILSGSHGAAARAAMRIILRMASLQGARELLDVTRVHIDGCVYTGPASLAFAEKLRAWGGRVVVPTTLNSISVDQRRWRRVHGVPPALGEPAERLGAAYTDMGARPTFTCAPYLLGNGNGGGVGGDNDDGEPSPPRLGEQVAWAESNAVVYANSVLGARTMKYPDYLDVAIALTGRAPRAGPHVETNRRAEICVRVPEVQNLKKDVVDDSFWPILGYCVGGVAANRIPVVAGLADLTPSNDNLKAFGAAFATSSSAPMFHMVGVTPEAPTLEAAVGEDRQVPAVDLELRELRRAWDTLNSADAGQPVDLVSLGNPHFSLHEIKKLAQLCCGRTKHEKVALVVTCGRSTHGLATQAGLVAELEQFGVQFVTDTCWCMIQEPVVPHVAKLIMTNSGKYAHYGPGLTGRRFYFGSLASCVSAACEGFYSGEYPPWLSPFT